MIDTTDTGSFQYRVAGLRIFELRDLPRGRTWMAAHEDGYIVIRADLAGDDRSLALGEALGEMMVGR